jgi:hypothetical protein
MADCPMTDHERNEWLVAKRLKDGNLHPQTRAIDVYELIRTRARATAGEHAAEPIPAGTSFTLVGRRLRDDER